MLVVIYCTHTQTHDGTCDHGSGFWVLHARGLEAGKRTSPSHMLVSKAVRQRQRIRRFHFKGHFVQQLKSELRVLHLRKAQVSGLDTGGSRRRRIVRARTSLLALAPPWAAELPSCGSGRLSTSAANQHLNPTHLVSGPRLLNLMACETSRVEHRVRRSLADQVGPQRVWRNKAQISRGSTRACSP